MHVYKNNWTKKNKGERVKWQLPETQVLIIVLFV